MKNYDKFDDSKSNTQNGIIKKEKNNGMWRDYIRQVSEASLNFGEGGNLGAILTQFCYKAAS